MSRLKSLENIFEHVQNEAGHMAHRASHIVDGHAHGAHDEEHATARSEATTQSRAVTSEQATLGRRVANAPREDVISYQPQPEWMQSTLATPTVTPNQNIANVRYGAPARDPLAHEKVNIVGMEMDRSAALGMAGMATEGGLGLLTKSATSVGGAAVGGVGAVIRAHAADVAAEDQKKDVAAQYADVIGQQLGVPENQVSVDHLYAAAKTNPLLQDAIQNITDNEKTEQVSAFTGAGGAFAGMAALTAMASNPVGWVGLGIAGIGGAFGAETITRWMSGANPEYSAVAHMDDIYAKLQTEGKIATLDVFQVFSRTQPALSNIEARYGKPLEAMSEAEQTKVMMRDYLQWAQAAAGYAEAINAGTLDPKILAYSPQQMVQLQQQMLQEQAKAAEPVQEFATAGVIEMQPEAGSWAARVGGSREMTSQGYAAQIVAERAAAEVGPHQI